jgi:hypothetical protein
MPKNEFMTVIVLLHNVSKLVQALIFNATKPFPKEKSRRRHLKVVREISNQINALPSKKDIS